MVVDPNKHDVSEFRSESVGDTSHDGDDEDDDHGFVWVSDEPEEDSQNNDGYHRSNEDGTSSDTQSDAQSDTQSQSREKRRQPLAWGHTESISDGVSDEKRDEETNTRQKDNRKTDWGRTDDLPWSAKAVSSSRSHPQSQSKSRSREKRRQSAEYEPTDPDNDTGQDPETRSGPSDHRVQQDDGADERDPDSDDSSESQRQQHARTAIDPIGYDVKELHTVSECGDVDSLSIESETEAHGFVWSDPPEEHRARIEDPTPEQHDRLLTLAGIDPEMVGEKPYLTRVSSEAAGGFVVDWLEFLAREAGTEGAIDAIERYQEIGWFTESVEEDLRNSIQWINQRNGNGFEVFDRGDHLLSFAYVAKIASVNSKGMMFY